VRWLLYALGAGLPPQYREWVLHDATARTWVLRHLLRTTLQLLPFAVLLYLLVPGSPGIRAASVGAGLALGFFYSVAYMYETTENRVIKAGYPRGTAGRIRDQRGAGAREEEARRYAERYRNQPPTGSGTARPADGGPDGRATPGPAPRPGSDTAPPPR